MKKALTGDGEHEINLDLLDGWDELENEEHKDKISKALEQGYVSDEDWLGVGFSVCGGVGWVLMCVG